MREPEDLCRVYEEALEYLRGFDGVDDGMIERHLGDWRGKRTESIPAVYERVLRAAVSRQGMRNSIGSITALDGVLFGFNPRTVVTSYGSWEAFFRAVETHQDLDPPGRLVIDNPRSHWVQFSKTVVSAAGFLSEFDTIGGFEEFTGAFLENEYTRYALPLFISERVHGLGFALACSVLMETGHPGFVKPDVHLRDLFVGLGLSDARSDYDLFIDVIRYAAAIDELPYRVDKVFWLVGSGRFYHDDLRVPTDKQVFIERAIE